MKVNNILRNYFFVHFLKQSLSDFDGSKFKGSLEKVIAEKPCVRLFTNDGDIGCRTGSRDGNLGALFEIRTDKDINRIKDIVIDFAVLLSGKYFNASTLNILSQSGHVQGVIVVDDYASIQAPFTGKYSVDVTHPQGLGTPQAQLSWSPNYGWNGFGNGLMYNSYQFPIVRADISEYSLLQKYCSENRDVDYDKSSKLNLAKFQYYMGGSSITSKACLEWTDIYGYRDPKCLPVGGQSVWASAGSLDQRSKVLATVAIDSTAEFHDLAYGANDAVASIVALLSAAEALGRSNHASLPSQILFLFANAEEWGYAGSRRFVRDLLGFECDNPIPANETKTGFPLCAAPVYPNTLFQDILQADVTLDSVLAIDQIGRCNGNFYIHAVDRNNDDNNNNKDSVSDVIMEASGYVSDVTVAASNSNNLPPSPLSSFELAYDGFGSSFTGAVLSGYAHSFNDPYYHTRFDNSSRVHLPDIIKAAQLTATTLYKLAGGNILNSPRINETYTEAVLACLLLDWECDLMNRFNDIELRNVAETAGPGAPGVSFGSAASPPNYYVGVLTANGAGGGQPVVNRQGNLFGRFEWSWRANVDSAFVVPNLLTAFLRSQLAYHLSSPLHSAGESTGEGCASSSSCGRCIVLGSYNVTGECAGGRCVCPSAFYHLAVDPGIEAEQYPATFRVVNTSTPSYTEPYWSTIQLSVYPTASHKIGAISISLGVVVTVISVVCAFFIQNTLSDVGLL